MKLAAGLLLLLAAAPSAEIRYFRYQRPITPATQGLLPSQTCFPLDAGVFSHAAPQLNDLRLYRDAAETPYVIRVAAAAQTDEKPVPLLNLGERAGQTVFDTAMPESKYGDLQLDVSAQNFIATISVSGSQSQNGGSETKVGSYTIFDLSNQKLGRSTILHLPESDFRYLHFSVSGPLVPKDFTGLITLRSSVSEPKYETVAESQHATRKDHSSVIEFIVPAHTPVDRVLFTPGAEPANFSRDVRVDISPVSGNPAKDASALPQTFSSSGTLLRIHSGQSGHRLDAERLAIETSAGYADTPSKWIVTVDNGDDAPITIKSVRLQMLQRNLCFDAVNGVHYTLFYGDATLAAPHYDYASLFVPQVNASHTTAGPEQENAAYQSRPDLRPFTEKHPALLWIALIAVIVLLGVIALRSLRSTTQTPR